MATASAFCPRRTSSSDSERFGGFSYSYCELPESGSKRFGPSRSTDDKRDSGVDLAGSVLRLRDSKQFKRQVPRMDCSAGKSCASPSVSSSSASAGKRKSAVELLAESKAFYVKSETVLDRKQELPLRVNSTLCTGTNSGTHYATLSGRHRRGLGGEPLQNQLRRLLGSTSSQSPNISHENRSQTLRYGERKKGYSWDSGSRPPLGIRRCHDSGTRGSKGQIKSDPEHTKTSNRPSSSGDNRIFFPDNFVIPKPSKSDPANVFSNSFSVDSPYSSPEKIDARQILSVVDAYDTRDQARSSECYDDILDNYGTISPPAEYAVTERSNYRYVRSNSHSNTLKIDQENPYVINFDSHKSLPDLHRQAEHYAETGRRLIGIGGSGHCLPGYSTVQSLGVPDQPQMARSNETLSCYSKATSGQSYRSSSKGSASIHNSEPVGNVDRGSADEVYYYNRSGSSYARDSGGSSGHCSGPLGPPSLRGLPPTPTSLSSQQRRDSGSSTQHSSTRSHKYQGCDANDASQLEYRVSAPLQFQDGIRFGHIPNNGQLAVNATVSISTNFTPRNEVIRNPSGSLKETCQTSERPALVGIHFRASIPPVQFQDAHPMMYAYTNSFPKDGFYGRRESGTRESRHLLTRRPASSGYNKISTCYDDDEPAGTHTSPYGPEESPPGLGNFKRQRCLRYKHRSASRRPILRSKSDISDRYWRNDDKRANLNIDKGQGTPPSSDNSPSHAAQIKLNKFFDQLGMDDETYEEVILKDLKKHRPRKSKQIASPNRERKQDSDSNSKCSDDEGNDELSSSFASSDISFPDSNLIPSNADYTVQGMNDNKPYRSYEPLSIVERNARIIKWLCNCRKLQAA